jgi:hypothetical protein
MRTILKTLACVFLVLATSLPAFADDAPPADPATPVAVAPPAPTAAPPAAPPSTSPDPRDDRGWSLYHDAFSALLRGERIRARKLAQSLSHDFPGHPALTLVQQSELLGGPGGLIDRPRGLQPERPSRGARAELALFQTLHGMYVGVEVCILLGCEDGAAVMGLALAGAATGAAVSLNSLENLTSGQRALLNSGTAWGVVNGALLAIATEPDDAKTVVGTLLAGQAAGLALGASLFAAKPTAGQVGLVNSAGQWAGVVTGLAVSSFEKTSDKDTATAMLVAVDVGLVAGAYFASKATQVTRAQTLLIDAGGIVGTVAGGSLGVILSGNFDDPSTRRLAAAGAIVGVGAAYYLTRNWTRSNDDTGSLRAFIAPPEKGQGALAGVGMAW